MKKIKLLRQGRGGHHPSIFNEMVSRNMLVSYAIPDLNKMR